MAGHGQRRERLQEAAIVALMTCPTIPAAAQQVGICEKTLDSWLKDAAFSTAYRQARRDAVVQAVAVMEKAATSASETLLRNLRCGQPAVEVSAAKAIFDLVLRDETERRIDELEALLTSLRLQLPAPGTKESVDEPQA